MSRKHEEPAKLDRNKFGPFEIPEDKLDQIIDWKDKHNQVCKIPEWMETSIPTHKYKFEFRITGLGDSVQIICNCGMAYYPNAGDHLL